MLRLSFLLSATVLISACSSINLPDLNMLDGVFREDARTIGNDYPSIASAPVAPTDVRSDAAWDTAAKELIAKRDGFDAPQDNSLADTDVVQSIEELKAKARAYKLNDPDEF